MIPNPIHKVLSILSIHQVQYLLMGGQACVLYGGAEFSRDCDIAVLCDVANLSMLQAAIDDLQAETIAVPPFEVDYLLRGHAVHFRCRDQDAERMRLDVMARMRGVAPFEELWARRTTMELEAGGKVEVMSLPDLIAAKKTQRDKDWPMIRRLVEAHFALNQNKHTADRIRFWLAESRTPETLIQIASQHGQLADEITLGRPLIKHAKLADLPALERGLEEEEQHEREADRAYWAPLKAELEQLRHSGR